MIKPSTILLWIALCSGIFASAAIAQTPPQAGTNLFAPDVELVFEHITVDDGLPENSVRSILQDSSGFLWLRIAANVWQDHVTGLNDRVFGFSIEVPQPVQVRSPPD